jgi:mRNA interferase RelE/StbE
MSKFKIIYDENFNNKYLNKLSISQKKRLKTFIEEKLAVMPHYFAIPLKGTLNDLWRARVGDLRIIFKLINNEILIIIIKIEHRKNIYK